MKNHEKYKTVDDREKAFGEHCKTNENETGEMKDNTSTSEAEASIDAEVVLRIAEHYLHARRKHPYFCDVCSPTWLSPTEQKEIVANALKMFREDISDDVARGRLMWDALLNCEVWEVHDAIARGDKAHAVYECYDAIAVLLRVVDVLEGRQKLGKPNESEEAR